MASGPEALFVFNSDNCFATPLMVIDRLSMAGILSYPISGMFDKSSWVKTLGFIIADYGAINFEICNPQLFFIQLFDIWPESLRVFFNSFP